MYSWVQRKLQLLVIDYLLEVALLLLVFGSKLDILTVPEATRKASPLPSLASFVASNQSDFSDKDLQKIVQVLLSFCEFPRI